MARLLFFLAFSLPHFALAAGECALQLAPAKANFELPAGLAERDGSRFALDSRGYIFELRYTEGRLLIYDSKGKITEVFSGLVEIPGTRVLGPQDVSYKIGQPKGIKTWFGKKYEYLPVAKFTIFKDKSRPNSAELIGAFD